MSEGRGHGKVILLGEHAVVHGHPALAMAIDLGVRVTARPGHGTLTVPAWDLAVDLARDAGTAPARALLALADAIGVDARGVALVAEAPLPARAGLGSSAALSVAVVRALAAHAGHALDDDAVARAADAGERVFHGNPSGIDVALAARGGVGRFVRGVGLMPLVAPPLTLVVALSGSRATPRRAWPTWPRSSQPRRRRPAPSSISSASSPTPARPRSSPATRLGWASAWTPRTPSSPGWACPRRASTRSRRRRALWVRSAPS